MNSLLSAWARRSRFEMSSDSGINAAVSTRVFENASTAMHYARSMNLTPHIIVTDARENIIYANNEFLEFTGFEASQMYGRKCNMLQVREFTRAKDCRSGGYPRPPLNEKQCTSAHQHGGPDRLARCAN